MGKKVAGKAASRTGRAAEPSSSSKGTKSPSRKKPGKGRLYEIGLTATRNAAGDVEFQPDNKFWHKPTNSFRFSKDSSDHAGMAKRDYHLVEFRLEEDETGLNLRFPPDPKDAMWVINDARCPTPADQNQFDVAKPVAVIDEHTLLAVNLNQKKGKFGFRLNFVGDGCTDYIPWDPIGDNHNGGRLR